MRAVLLLFVAGGLLWFVWLSSGAAPAVESGEVIAASPGAMLPPEPAPSTSSQDRAEPPRESDAVRTASSAVPEPAPAPVAKPAPIASEPIHAEPPTSETIRPPAAADPRAEIELARQLILDPAN